MLSLDDYAAAHDTTKKCGVCSLPDEYRKAVEENDRRERPHPPKVVAAWATEKAGRRVTTDMLQKHFYRDHVRIQ